MINKQKMMMKSFVIAGIMTIMLCSLVSAFAISFSFSAENPLTVYPGEVKDVVIRIKTGEVEGAKIIKAEILDNAGIAELTDSNLEYEVSHGNEGDGLVNMRLSAPRSAVIGSKYLISMTFVDVTPDEETGMVGFSQSSSPDVGVLVVEKPVEPETEEAEGMGVIWWWVIGIIIVIIAIWALAKNKKPTKK